MEDIYTFLELRMINRAQGGLNSMRLLMWIRWTPGWPPTHGLEDLPPQELEFQGANPPCMVQIYQILTFVGKTEGVLLFCDVA